MDTFLTDLYDRGLAKVAVAGPSTPPKPEASAVKTLDADSKALAKKTTPPEEPTAAEKKAELVLTAMRATRDAPAHIKTAAARYVGEKMRGIEKKAGPEHVVEPESWWQGQQGMGRAMRAGDSGLNKYLADSELVGDRLKRGLVQGLVGTGIGAGVGGLGGAAVGHLVSRRPGAGALIGALTGAAVGGGIGDMRGQMHADRDYLAKRGIQTTGFLNLGRGKYTPEAANKYLGSDPEGNAGK